MPRIADNIQNCVIYLYQTVEDAWAGKRAGGSGFVIAVRSAIRPECRVLYAITNSRIIKSGFPVIRTDALNQEIIPFEKGRKDWVHHPQGEDVAACLLGLASDYPQVNSYRLERLLTRELLDHLEIGIGSDVFLMERHITRGDVQCLTPVARFGKLAMMDRQFIKQPDGQSRICFLVSVLLAGGHSGAPVFVSSDHELNHEAPPANGSATAAWLLGIDQGHLQREQPVINAQGERHPRGWKVQSQYGHIVVTPVWKLRELLSTEQLSGAQRALERQIGKAQESGAGNPERGGRPFTAVDYQNRLRVVSRKLGTVLTATEVRTEMDVFEALAVNEPSYLLEDFKRDFPDEDSCLDWLKDYLYADGIYCRKCQTTTPHARVISRRSYSCARCGHHVHPTVGTIYHNSRLSLQLWFEATYRMTSTADRVTATQLGRELRVNYKTACRMWNGIRNALPKNGS